MYDDGIHTEAERQAGQRIRCTSCGKRFTLGAAHQQRIRREDGMNACADCVGCVDEFRGCSSPNCPSENGGAPSRKATV